MSFIKKLFDKNDGQEEKTDLDKKNLIETYRKIPWMTEDRLENLTICLESGFKPVASLPTELNRKLRPSVEIAKRLNAIKAIVLWLMVPQMNLADDVIQDFVDRNYLEDFLAEDEKMILESPRNDDEARNLIGWKFENAWPLAWYFGYKEPDNLGEMMTGEQMQEILNDFTCPLDENIENWILGREIISEENLINKEDLFYCLHNAVRSAQMGGKTVPENFDPIGNGGVIHERRHSLTWILSEGVDWDDTDLST